MIMFFAKKKICCSFCYRKIGWILFFINWSWSRSDWNIKMHSALLCGETWSWGEGQITKFSENISHKNYFAIGKYFTGCIFRTPGLYAFNILQNLLVPDHNLFWYLCSEWIIEKNSINLVWWGLESSLMSPMFACKFLHQLKHIYWND